MRLSLIIFVNLFSIGNIHGQTVQKKIVLVKNTTADSVRIMKMTAITQECTYLSQKEKDVIQWINIARMYPKWFILQRKIRNTDPIYTATLIKTMMSMKPITKKLIPNRALYQGALCHVQTAGPLGHIGHDRKSSRCKKIYHAECIYYGYRDAAGIVQALLIDRNVPSLGHRKSLLNPQLKYIGVSIGPHGNSSSYSQMCVVDFRM